MSNWNDRLFRWYPAVLLLALAAVTFWLDQKVQPLPIPRDGSTRHDPDFLIDDFSAMRMNPDGSQRYALRGTKMTHYPDDNSTVIEQPRFIHYDPKTAPVRIRSDEALISQNGDDVYFSGNVHIVREAYADQKPMSLVTEYLHLMPDQDLAETDKAVRMTQGKTVVESVGMRFDNKARILNLLSNVRVDYASPLNLSAFGRK
ncbi:MAG: LPS export ABC transporter periplasmic protein LptC [Betaproteobacteria bacterium]|nr:LPS export ABC transporter periplasmic protein LptC [Betaproteobacteria bacterium]